MTSNAIMFGGKLYAAILSGSASMFAESLHSLADMLNESLLMYGIRRSLREPDANHPYGFSSERTAWALVSGVGIFFLGGGVSLYHGISGLLVPHTLGDATVAQGVLALSLCFELVTMAYAFRAISRSAASSGMSFFDYIRRGSDPTAVQVFLEDCSAVVGIAIAGICVSLSKLLNLPFIDAFGSISIGVLLGSLAIFLVKRNIASLVESAMPLHRQKGIEAILEADPVIRQVTEIGSLHDVKTTQIGPDWVRFKAEVLFKGDEVTRRYILRNKDALTKDLERLRETKTDAELEEWLVRQGAEIITALGQEVDRIELELKAKVPEVKHCDLEM
ncbi:cation efflux family-domain-containing protein [Zopfochytrium polystomum]|nr:cation efflux family-domain-containing protein [Zopfochytrium polystomum]